MEHAGKSFSSHKGVISGFGQEFVRNGRFDPSFHQLWIKAFEKRQQADYLAETGLEREEVSELLAEAESFVRVVESWFDRASG